MAEYEMDDGTTVRTEAAVRLWKDWEDWFEIGGRRIPTSPPVNRQTLHLTPDGRFYIVFSSQVGEYPSKATWVTAGDAMTWLRRHDHAVPAGLFQPASGGRDIGSVGGFL